MAAKPLKFVIWPAAIATGLASALIGISLGIAVALLPSRDAEAPAFATVVFAGMSLVFLGPFIFAFNLALARVLWRVPRPAGVQVGVGIAAYLSVMAGYAGFLNSRWPILEGVHHTAALATCTAAASSLVAAFSTILWVRADRRTKSRHNS